MADGSLTRATLVLTWILTSFAIITVVLRFYVRRKLARGWASHDWIMLAALLCQIVYQVGITLLCNAHSGMPTNSLTPAELVEIDRLSWIFAPFTHPTSILARISIAIVLAHLFGTKPWFKWYIIIFTSILTAAGIETLITNVAQAQPYAAMWDKSIPNAIRWDPAVYHWSAVVLQIFYVIWDFTFVLFPVKILWKLNMRFRRKAGLMLLMGSMLIVMAAATSKMVISALFSAGNTKTLDPYIFQHAIDFSTCVEQALVIIMGCVPTLYSITKLPFPSMSDISGSFTTLVSKVRRITSNEKVGSSFEEQRTSIENLELTPRLNISNDSRLPPNKAQIMASLSDAEGDDLPPDHGLRRTDSFTVTYHDRVRQVQGV
ncbi:hypothetical protein M426DRAFT_22657 [Hypoxylon sp. CI-4A]|nr:hypothetical protein M426DRAFT_22657 [Hypoxylon sp. CI-4A]